MTAVQGVEAIEGECSFCYLERLRRASRAAGGVLTTNPATSLAWPKGVHVRISGEAIVWLSEMPTECRCEAIPASKLFGSFERGFI